MFTGLIREMASVESFEGSKLCVRASYTPKIGDSIAINGVCLTVVSLRSGTFCVELSPETQKVVAIENYRNQVHMEPAMMMGDRFEGHIVQGHVDTIGKVDSIKDNGNSYDVVISMDEAYMGYVIPKGSITIDGVSLTVNEVFNNSFRLTIIPHTMKETLFATYTAGSRVNVETDMFARYVDNILQHREQRGLQWSEVERIHALY